MQAGGGAQGEGEESQEDSQLNIEPITRLYSRTLIS